MTARAFTDGERVFLARMVPHIAAGLSFDAAAAAVLADDERLFCAVSDRGGSQYVPTPDERGRSYHSGERTGDLIASDLAREVYDRIRGTESRP